MALFSTTPARLMLAAFVVAVVGGIVYLAVRAGGDNDGESQVASKVTRTAALLSTQTSPQAATRPPEPIATLAPTTEPATVPPLPTTTPDTRVPMSLPRADQIQLGKDGKYFVADRGDGCMWLEHGRETDPVIGLQVFLRTDCPADFVAEFRPATREVFAVVS